MNDRFRKLRHRLLFVQVAVRQRRDNETAPEAGFSTLEALVAFFILAMILGGTVQLLSTSSRQLHASAKVDEDQEAIRYIEAELLPELLKSVVEKDAAKSATSKGWLIKLSPLPNSSNNSTGHRLVHISITQGQTGSDLIARKSAPYSTFRLVNKSGDGL